MAVGQQVVVAEVGAGRVPNSRAGVLVAELGIVPRCGASLTAVTVIESAMAAGSRLRARSRRAWRGRWRLRVPLWGCGIRCRSRSRRR